jgi:predicted MFS family arabinose efflux permease
MLKMIKSYLQTLYLFSRNTWLYLIVNSLTSISYVGIYVMLFNLYLLRLDYGPEFIGLVNAAAQLGVAAFSIPAGILGRRWGSRRMTIVGLTVATIGLGLVPLAEFIPMSWQTTWLVVTYIFAWLGGGTYIVNSLPFLMSVTDSMERAHAFSMREALVPLSVFAGSLIGGLLPGFLVTYLGGTLADPMPYRYTLFIAAALFSLAPITMLATSEANAEDRPQQQLQTLSPAGQTPAAKSAAPIGLMVFMGTVILLQLASKNITDTFFNVYLDVSLHLSPLWIGTLSAIAQLLAVPVALVAPLVLAKWGKGWTIIGGTLGMAFSLWLLILMPHWVGAGLGLMGVSALFAITIPAFTICNQELVSPEWRATMSGGISMAMGLSRSGMAFGGGYLITSFGFSTLFLVGTGLTMAGAVLFWGYTWLPRRYILHRAALKVTS